MSSLNKVQIIGNLGKDPEVRTFPDGGQITTCSIATSEKWKEKSGQPQERTEWHRVVFRGKLAEIAGQYLHKGSKVYVEGQLQTRKWQGQDGQDRYSTEVVVGVRGTMVMLDGRPQQAPQQASAGNQHQNYHQEPQGVYRPSQAQVPPQAADYRPTQAQQAANQPADFDESMPF